VSASSHPGEIRSAYVVPRTRPRSSPGRPPVPLREAGLVLLVWPALSILTLAILAGIWLILVGVMQITVAVQLRRLA
jgi:Short repeat of unknown function (DUF308)